MSRLELFGPDRFRSALYVGFIIGVPLCATADPSAQQQEIESLRQQLHELQARVERLEGNMAAGVPVNPALKVQPVPGGWRKAVNWSLLSKDLTDYEVLEILGEPMNRKTVKKFEFWEYGDGKASLYMRRLKSWELPSGLEGD
jgi:hypothetical protein